MRSGIWVSMMSMTSISALRDWARETLKEFAWSQWVQLGLSGHATRVDRWAIDPEALVLFTIEVARRDPRLFDEMLDWMSVNGQRLSLQRLRNLLSRFPIDRRLVEAVIGWVGESSPGVRWTRTAKLGGDELPGSNAVFSPDVVSFVGERDAVFARHGYVRPQVHRSGKSMEPEALLPANLAFRLRSLFGPGIRSEVIRVLLTFSEAPLDAARIADEAAFAKRNVNDALAAFSEAGVVQARWSGNERVFLLPRSRWAALLDIGTTSASMPTFVSWVHLLPALVQILLWLEQEAESGDSDYLVSSRARDLMDRIAPELEAVGVEVRDNRSLPGAAYLPAFEERIRSLISTISSSP